MTTTRGRFLYLLADLARDPKLRDRLIQDPPTLLDQYGISGELQAVLRAGDTDQLVSLIGSEARELIDDVRQQPHVMMPWPTHVVAVQTCKPGTGAINTLIDFTITGTLFDKQATLRFAAPGVTVAGSDVSVHSDGQGNSVMTARASFTTAATYDVIVSNPNGDSGTLPAGFTAKK